MFVHKVLFEFLEFMHPRLLLVSPAIRLHVPQERGGVTLNIFGWGCACRLDPDTLNTIPRSATFGDPILV